MARPRSINKTAILEAAEELVTETGGLRFTMDMVAARAGISKGGLTYTYPTKDALVEDMLRRELSRFVAQRETHAKSNNGYDRVVAHIEVSAQQKHVYQTRAAQLMAALANGSRHLEIVQDFYREIFDLIDAKVVEWKRQRHALLAIEGLFLLRGLGLMPITNEEWDDVFAFALKEIERDGNDADQDRSVSPLLGGDS